MKTEKDIVATVDRICAAREVEAKQRRLDLFAAAALTGILSASRGTVDRQDIATDAWLMARAMLDNEPKED